MDEFIKKYREGNNSTITVIKKNATIEKLKLLIKSIPNELHIVDFYCDNEGLVIICQPFT